MVLLLAAPNNLTTAEPGTTTISKVILDTVKDCYALTLLPVLSVLTGKKGFLSK
jgi:hypothetical protein